MARDSGYTHMAEEERRLLKKWRAEGKSCSDIARLLGRDKGTISRQVKRLSTRGPKARSLKVGRPKALDEKTVERLVSKTKALTRAADAKYQVTAAMIRKAMKLKCSERVILAALHAKGIYMRPLREKPVRTPEDVQGRKDFAQEFACKSVAHWQKNVHVYIDNKHFPVYLHHKARDYAAKLRARGTYRAKGQGLHQGHLKPPRALKFNTGAKSLQVAAGISAKGVLMWHVVDGQWNGAAAEMMYKDVLAPALQKAYGKVAGLTLLEDNDPSGYKSGKGKAAKAELRLCVLELPRRSPDLNPLDYGLWAEVNKRMRNQELKYKAARKETVKQYAARLRRTAMRIPAAYFEKLIGSMQRRCKALRDADGHDFEE